MPMPGRSAPSPSRRCLSSTSVSVERPPCHCTILGLNDMGQKTGKGRVSLYRCPGGGRQSVGEALRLQRLRRAFHDLLTHLKRTILLSGSGCRVSNTVRWRTLKGNRPMLQLNASSLCKEALSRIRLSSCRVKQFSVQARLRVDRQEAASTKRLKSVICNYGLSKDPRSLSPNDVKF